MEGYARSLVRFENIERQGSEDIESKCGQKIIPHPNQIVLGNHQYLSHNSSEIVWRRTHQKTHERYRANPAANQIS